MLKSRRVYVSCHLWDGVAAAAVEDAALLVEGEEIVAVGPRSRLLGSPEAQAAERIDLGGRTVLPGLIDAHVHLQFPFRAAGDFLLTLVEPLEFTVLKAARNAQVYIAAGVTSVFDCGCRGNLAVALREAIDRGLCVGPRVVASGVPISPTGGWADDHASFVHNDCPQGIVADTPDDWRRIVRRQIKEGVDNIKIGVSGSAVNPYSDPHASDMSREEIALVVDLAHRAGVTVAVHCDPARGFLDSVRAGVDTIHHGKEIDDDCIEALADGATYFMPTAVKLKALIEDGPRCGRRPEAIAALARGFDRYLAALGRCLEAGLADRMAAGSDAGNLPPGHGSTAREIEVLREVGMTPVQALRSATSVAAEAIGLGDLTGTLAPGKKADFIVVDGDPLADVRVLADRARIAGVYKGGRLVAERGRMVAQLDLDRELTAEPVYGRRPHRRR
jgi:imidazolonepropionase-like amidohydrolase